MKYLFFLIFACQVLIAQNVQFSVKDSITKKPIGYVNLRINNKYQMVSNENGEFIFDDASIHTFEFSCIGYVDKLVQRADLASDVFLTPSVTKLKEVVVKQKPKLKPKSITVSAEMHQDFSKSFTSNHSMSLAFFVEGALNESYLEAITIPIMPLNLKAPSHSSHYKTVPECKWKRNEFYKIDEALFSISKRAKRRYYFYKNKSRFRASKME
jgi:hypothetical protein